jgi:ATP-dependent protease Clp ATPase subunit
MNQNATDTLTELKEFVAQQASEDASLSVSEKRHQAQVVREVLSDQVASPKTLKRLIDEYIAGCSLSRTKTVK